VQHIKPSAMPPQRSHEPPKPDRPLDKPSTSHVAQINNGRSKQRILAPFPLVLKGNDQHFVPARQSLD